MLKHTPGPWKFEMGQITARHPHAHPNFSRNAIATIHQAKCSHCEGYPVEANAHLIAAAPDLLLACKLALSSCDPHAATTRLIEAAIAKAEGK